MLEKEIIDLILKSERGVEVTIKGGDTKEFHRVDGNKWNMFDEEVIDDEEFIDYLSFLDFMANIKLIQPL